MERTKFGLIGAGGWGETHARAFADHPGVDLVADDEINAVSIGVVRE